MRSWLGACRTCRAPLDRPVLDLGVQPFADDLLEFGDTSSDDVGERLELHVCQTCWLVQLPIGTGVPRAALHSHGGGFSSTWLAHQRAWHDQLRSTITLPADATVVQIGPDDNSALEPYAQDGMRVATWASHDEVRAAAEDGVLVDLVLVSHALSHTDDPLGFMSDVVACLSVGGVVAIEFHSVRELVRSRQFDIACHTHRAYFSLTSLAGLLDRIGCVVHSARTLDMHGGSVRVVAHRAGHHRDGGDGGRDILEAERSLGLDTSEGYEGLTGFADQTRAALRGFLAEATARETRVVGYGAPTRGTTLLNYCQVTTEEIAYTVDRNPAKQGLRLPGCGLPVHPPDMIDRTRPDVVVILPWTLAAEIREQLHGIRSWGGRFAVALPSLRILD